MARFDAISDRAARATTHGVRRRNTVRPLRFPPNCRDAISRALAEVKLAEAHDRTVM
jgi:hypothetical protein